MPDKFNPSRTVRSRRTEFRTRSEGETPTLSGYFVVFDQPYYWDETMEEVIKPGAFANCDMSDVRCLTDHLSHLVLGRANETVHTLSFSIDDTGVFTMLVVTTSLITRRSPWQMSSFSPSAVSSLLVTT